MDSTTQEHSKIMASTVNDADRLDVATTDPCYLLDIAAELRNGIYELALTTNEAKVDLLSSKPPSSALLRCYKQISKEASGTFKASTRDYYETKHFNLALEEDKAPITKLNEVAKRFDMQRMKHLQFKYSYELFGSHIELKYTVETNKVFWHCTNGDPPYYFVFIHGTSGYVKAEAIHAQSEADRDADLAHVIEVNSIDLVTIRVKAQIEIYCKSMSKTLSQERAESDSPRSA